MPGVTVNRHPLVIAGIGTVSVAVGYALEMWSIMMIGAVTVLFVVWGAISDEPASDATVALLFGLAGAGLLGFGLYAVVAIDSLFGGIVVIVGVGLPALLFLLIAWSAAVFAVTGERPRTADRIVAWFDAGNRPLRNPFRRSTRP